MRCASPLAFRAQYVCNLVPLKPTDCFSLLSYLHRVSILSYVHRANLRGILLDDSCMRWAHSVVLQTHDSLSQFEGDTQEPEEVPYHLPPHPPTTRLVACHVPPTMLLYDTPSRQEDEGYYYGDPEPADYAVSRFPHTTNRLSIVVSHSPPNSHLPCDCVRNPQRCPRSSVNIRLTPLVCARSCTRSGRSGPTASTRTPPPRTPSRSELPLKQSALPLVHMYVDVYRSVWSRTSCRVAAVIVEAAI